jgi:hypothetical protein
MLPLVSFPLPELPLLVWRQKNVTNVVATGRLAGWRAAQRRGYTLLRGGSRWILA